MSDPYAPTAPGLRTRKRRKTGRYALIGLAITVALTGSVGIAFAMGWGIADEKAKPTAPATVTAYGQMQLDLGGFAWNRSPEQCWGHKGYDDIRAGAPVTITDPSGKVVALGELQAGKPQISGDRATGCLLRFEVDVPAGLKFYGVEVSHRGSVKFPEDELTGKGVTLSLG